MKKNIFNNLYNEIIVFFLVSSITLTLIVWILQAVNFLDIISDDGHSIATYFLYSSLNFPKIFNKLLLLSYFLSIFYILSLYEDKNQLIIYWINGVGKTKFLNKIISFSILFLILSFLLSYFITPFTQNKARSYIRTSNLDFFPSLIKPKKFIDTVENLTIFLEQKNENKIQKILLKDDSESGSAKIILANSGQIINNPENKYLTLKDGLIINFSDRKNSTTFNFEETNFNLNKYKTKTTTTPKIQEIKSQTIFTCLNLLRSNYAVSKKIDNLRCDKTIFKNLIQEAYKRLYLPLYIPLLSIIASFIILKSNNDINYKSFKIKIFLLGIFLIVLSQISVNTVAISFSFGIATILLPIILILGGYLLFKNKAKISS